METKEVPLIPGEKMPAPNGCTIIAITAEFFNEAPVYVAPVVLPVKVKIVQLFLFDEA